MYWKVNGKIGKLEPRSEVCMFEGYPKGMRGSLSCSRQDNKVILLTNVMFWKQLYEKLKIWKQGNYGRVIDFSD